MKYLNKISHVFILLILIFFSCKKEKEIKTSNPAPSATSCETIDTNITTTRTLTNRVADPNIPDYCITNFIEVTNGAGLIIEPGVVIEFAQDAGIMIGGADTNNAFIRAKGNAANKIVFTGASKTPGFWKGILIKGKKTINNELDHCVVEYAGSSDASYYSQKIAIYIESYQHTSDPVALSLKNSTVRHNAGVGYYNNISTDVPISLHEFENNHFEDNTGEAIQLPIYLFHIVDKNTTFLNNGFDGIYQIESINKSYMNMPGNFTWENTNGSYFISRSVVIQHATSFDSITLNWTGGITVIVEDNKKIEVKTNSLLRSIGGSSSNKNVIRGKKPGTYSWAGILITSDLNNLINNTIISEGGSAILSSVGCNGKANIGVYYLSSTWRGKVTVTNSELKNSGGCGIFNQSGNGDLTQYGNSFGGNASSTVCN